MSSELKVAFLSKELPSDRCNGVSVQVHRLANALVKQGVRITCYSFSPKPDRAGYDHVHLQYGTANPVWKKIVPGIRFRSLKLSSCDIVHCHGDDYLRRGSPLRVRTFYGSALNEALNARRFDRLARQGLFAAFEWVSCLRKGATVGISRTTKRSLPLIHRVIPCGVPLEIYTPGEKSPTPTVLFIGDFDSRKNGRAVLEAFHTTVREKVPGAILNVVGPRSCRGAGVRWLGTPEESLLVQHYREAWVYCMASTYEGFGVPLIEAMACGTPVVSVANAGAREVVQHHYDGLLGTEDTLGEMLVRMLTDEGLRRRIADNGLRSVKRFDMTRVAGEYLSLYANLVRTHT